MIRNDTHFWSPAHSDGLSESDLSKIHDTIKKRNLYHIPRLNFCCDCLERIEDDDFRSGCNSCGKQWHLRCIPSSPAVINHPFHAYHPLELLIDVPPEHSKGKCDACKEELKSYFYHCSLCNFSMHVRCSRNPPPPKVKTSKCHERELFCMVRNDTFTCNACGTHGERCPYVCAPCGVMFHRECIDLPHVININRHDHRVSHTYSLGFGNWKCMICHKMVDWRYGAYSCSTCPDYVVHSKCATRVDVWDGEELEGVPEETFVVSPFREIEKGLTIEHFSHKDHFLIKIDEEDDILDVSIRCEACVRPIFSETHYKCMQCDDFFIHETCANLPLRKRHWLSTKPFYLNANKDESKSLFRCDACETTSNGFKYESEGPEGVISLDIRCAFVISSVSLECHTHTLFLTTMDRGTCGGCKVSEQYVLRCTESECECDFSLCLACATLPEKIKRKGDEHFLFLRHGEKASGKYWCEVCEAVLDPREEWFYTCDVSGVTFHIKCVVGEFPNAKPGFTYHYHCVLGEDPALMYARYHRPVQGEKAEKIELVHNNRITRPNCATCGSRCLRPLILKLKLVNTYEVYCCDVKCSLQFLMNTTKKYQDLHKKMYGETSWPSGQSFVVSTSNPGIRFSDNTVILRLQDRM
ncbi:unnamed protein product [Brassica oleracea]|uniref:Phorbol-ester/DAG-type domain-containing protein n=2 Tax=Brassica oleracea TaxID=3712 RepID=A0A0D3AFN5_BRAOL|nr:PREDICTED: uncharacterized protein LOC106297430 [Brassica oleracea var. oleracea]VDD53367.1 unnamed protein product [Brassica oleracea]